MLANSTVLKQAITGILFLLLTCNIHAQQWIWAKQAYNKPFDSWSEVNAITTDRFGNIFEVGTFQDTTNFPPDTIYSYTTKTQIEDNAYLVKYDHSGNVLWVQTCNVSSWNSTIHGVVTDSSGDSYITGNYDSDTIKFGSVFYTNPAIGGGLFIAKFDPNGKPLWITGPSRGYANGLCITLDRTNNICVSGTYNDSLMFGKVSIANNYWGPYRNNNIYIAKLKPTGSIDWLITDHCISGHNAYVPEQALLLDNAGNIYLAGEFTDTIVFGSVTLPKGGLMGNVYLVKFDSSGNTIWGTSGILPSKTCSLYGISSIGQSNVSLTADQANNIYLTSGYVDSIKFGNFLLAAPQYSHELFLTKYNPSGKVIWAKTVKAGKYGANTLGRSLTADRWNNIYLAGISMGSFSFGGTNIYDTAYPNNDAFIMKLDTSGMVICDSITLVVGNTITIAADPFHADVYCSADLNWNSVKFDSTTLSAWPQISSFLVKWECSSCKLSIGIKAISKVCKGQGEWLKGIGTGYYSWSTGANNDSIYINPSSTSAYTLYVSNGICSGDTSVTVSVIPLPTPSISGMQKICVGDSTILTASGGSVYTWNNGKTTSSITVNSLTNTTYFVSVSDGFCTATDSVNVLVYTHPVPVITKNQYICIGSSTNLFVSGGTQYLWSNGETSSSITVSPISAKMYTVTLYNGPCSVKDSVAVFVNPLPIATGCCDSSIMYGQNVQLTSSGGSTYLWSPSQGLNCNICTDPIASPLVNTTYTLMVTSDSGCSAQQTITIDVSCGDVFVPEAFSPNGDGQNDVLYVRGDCINTLDFKVFDRWGNKVFETKDKIIG